MSLAIGTVFGAYQIISGLGAGGRGGVCRARYSRLRRDVALKVRRGTIRDTDSRRRFSHEANAAGALNHPNVVAVFDVNLDVENPYIVTELVEGESLRKVLDRGPVPLRKLIDIAVQVADGMSAAHQASIVHRDVKPEIILWTRDGRAKIVAFGLAKSRPPLSGSGVDESATVSMSALGAVMGTVEYMSPEQASGKRVDTRSDIFSFGLILYEMVNGQRAFIRRSKVETMEAIINAEPPPLAVELPLPLKWCIERCVAKDPQDRYISTLDLYHELRSIREHLPEVTSTFTGPIPTRRSQKIALWRVAQAAVLAGILLAGAAGAAARLAPQDPELPASEFHRLATGAALEDSPAWPPLCGVVAHYAKVDRRSPSF